MEISLPIIEKPDIYTYGFDKQLYRVSPEALKNPLVYDVVKDLTNPTVLISGDLIISAEGHIKQGQTDYNTGTGFWLGDVTGTAKFSIGNSSGNRLTWDGSALTIVGDMQKTAGDILFSSADTERTNTTTTYVEKKQITLHRGGEYRVKVDLKKAGANAITYAKLYRNDVSIMDTPWSTESDTYITKSTDSSGWSAGDEISLYIKTNSAGNTAYCKNFRLYVSSYDSATVDTD